MRTLLDAGVMTGLAERAYAAEWVVGPRGVIRDGVVAMRDGVVSYVGKRNEYRGFCRPEALERSVIFPGLIDAHVHTDFPPDVRLDFERGSMVSWVRAALEARSARSEKERLDDIRHSLSQMKKFGTVAFAEVSNDFLSLEPIVESGLLCRYFAERTGFSASAGPEIADVLRREMSEWRMKLERTLEEDGASANSVTIHSAAHAPYSTSAWLIEHLCGGELSTIHLAENHEEVELLRSGGGPWREYLRDIGRDDPEWKAPGLSPVEYVDSVGVWGSALLPVHLTQVTDSDIARYFNERINVTLCPRSNEFIGVGTPPVEKIFASGAFVCLGTDSLGSNSDHNLFAEMRALREIAGDVPASEIWYTASVNPARALRWTGALGRLEAGTAPGVFASAGVRSDVNTAEELFSFLIDSGDVTLVELAPAKLVDSGV